jgi:hypothetical protein
MPYYINPPPQNPLTRIIAAVIAVFALVGSFMIGMAALLVVVCVGLVAAISIWIRISLLKRRMKKEGVEFGAVQKKPPNSGHIIDAEYTVVTDDDDQQRK